MKDLDGVIAEYFGKTLLCRADYEGKNITGRISFSKSGVHIRLVVFDKFVHMEGGQRLSLQLEDNQYCTVETSPSYSGHSSTASDTCYYLDLDVRQVILGFRPWTENDRISELHFSLSDTNEMLEAPDVRRSITSSGMGSEPNATIISVSAGGTTATISYRYGFDSWNDDHYSVFGACGSLRFDEPRSTREVNDFLAVLHTFFTMASGIKVWTQDYLIIPTRNQEQPLIGGGSAPASFELMWPGGRDEEPKKSNVTRPTSVLRCYGESDRESASACLKFWMENWQTWNGAFSGLFLAICAGSRFDASRVLNACKWLESTPDYIQKNLGRDRELRLVADAALKKSIDLGLDLESRLMGSITRLGTESRNALLKRLIDRAVVKDDPKLKQRFLHDVHKAFAIRGHFAHSKFEHSSGDDFGEYVRCTQATEALAFLLLYRSLPLPADHHWGYGPNNLVEYLTFN